MKIKFFTIPNMLTLCNLLCGTAAVVVTLSHGELSLAFYLLIASAIFDFGDGFAAKMLGSYSEMGKQLDSLADVISFGLAPSVILYTMMVGEGFEYLSVVAFAIVACSALRLGKFNIDDSQSTEFCGLPTPANAMFFAALGYLYYNGDTALSPWTCAVLAIFMSSMLISPVRMFSLKFKSWALKDNKLQYSFIALSFIALVVLQVMAIPLIVLAYIAVSVFKGVVAWRVNKK